MPELPPTGPLPHAQRLFVDKPPEDYPKPDVNPYLKLHHEWGPPVLTAEQAASFRGRWHEAFGRAAPLHLEIGPGNGFHFSAQAAAHPEFNWLALEIRFKRVILTAKKLRGKGAEAQARVARYDATALRDLFVPGELSAVYVNHPDPWPKDRHAKNRLLCGDWLDLITELMAPGAELRLKTDHLINVEAVLENLPGRPLTLIGRSEDVNTLGAPWGTDYPTNYQRKFAERGEPVYAVWVRRD